MGLPYFNTGFFRQVSRFLLVGGLATLLDIVAFWILNRYIPEFPTVCFVLAFSLSVCSRFIADKRFTFQNAQITYGRQFALYICACVLTLGIGVVTFRFFLWLGVPEIGSKLLSIPFVTVSGFILFRQIVFRR